MMQHIIKVNKHKRNKSLHSNRFITKLNQEDTKKQQLITILQKAKNQYYNEHNLNKALQYFEQFLSQSPSNNQALYLCGVCYLNQNKPKQAISRLQKITFSYQNKDNSLLLLSMAYNKLNQTERSLQTINDCLRYFINFQEAYYFRAKMLLKNQQYQLAIKDFQYCLYLNSNSFLSKIGLGDCYRSQGKFQKALTFYTQVLESFQLQKHNRQELLLKSAICHFYLQRYKIVIELLEEANFTQLNKGSQYYFYLGQSYLNISTEKSKAVLNLQYCIKMQTNKTLEVKSTKRLLQLFVGDYQFYEALNIVKLAQNCKIQCNYWIEAVQSFMLIIKSKYQEGYQKIKNVYSALRGDIKEKVKIKTETKTLTGDSPFQSNKKLFGNKKSIQPKPLNQKLIQVSHRKANSLKHVRRPSLTQDYKKLPIFNKNTLFTHKRNISNSKYKIKLNNNFKLCLKKQQFALGQSKFVDSNCFFTQKQKMFLMPIVLKFKAYCQFFKNNYLRSLDTYDQYQSYMREVYGKQNNQDIQYQKCLCEALLMTQSQLYEEGLQKYGKCIDIFYKQDKVVPIEPVLYKIIHVMQMALNISNQISYEEQKYHLQSYLQTSLNLIQNYRLILKNSHIAYYLQGLACLLLQKRQSAQYCLQKTLKLAQQCSWKYLYVKGVIQIENDKYYDAIKEFTAGLILQQKSDLYLGRSIAFLLQGFFRKKFTSSSETKQLKKSVNLNQFQKKQINLQQNKIFESQASSEIFIQNSFEDLQKFIQLQSQQEKISVWVTKLLFYNNAYEQASKAMQKINNKNQELLLIQQFLQVYEGNFEAGGPIGQIIIQAFQGKLIKQQQQKDIQRIQKQIQKQLVNLGFQKSYSKWLIALQYYVQKQYSQLLKFLQKQIFKINDQKADQLQIRYNIAVVYFLLGQTAKAINVLGSLTKFNTSEQLKNRIEKMTNLEFIEDQCIPDLQQQIHSSSLRLSNYLISHSCIIKKQKQLKIFIKLSIPFPEFPKPNIRLQIDQKFLKEQISLNMVEKKLHAPWINKKVNQIIQFTDEIIEANTQFLKQSKIKQEESPRESQCQKNNEISSNEYKFSSSVSQIPSK